MRCPLCSRDVASAWINEHIDAQCGASQPTTTQAGSSQQQSKRTLGGSSGAGDSGPKGKVTGDRRSSANPKRENAKTEDDGAVASSSSSRRVAEVASLSSLADDSATETRQTKRFKSSQAVESAKPLAERMRPGQLSDVVGQQALLAPNALLRRLIEQDKVGSILLWGPPGSGKTTLARVIANSTNSRFTELSATSASAADLRKVFDEATNMLKLTGRRTMCFIDEIQRFTKAQQDLLLPVVENGTISLLCSTTENPSFRINKALLSRMRVFVLEKLGADDIFALLVRALKAASDESEPASSTLDESLLRFLASAADGDARVALSSLELAISATRDTSAPLSREELKAQLRKAHLQYDRSGDAHCDTISALHKSVRGSNADAALYWLARMLEAGDDPLYVARRLIRMASEDVGTADPTVLPEAVAAYQAALLIGMPECDCVLAQVSWVTLLLRRAMLTACLRRASGRRATCGSAEKRARLQSVQRRQEPRAQIRSISSADAYSQCADWTDEEPGCERSCSVQTRNSNEADPD